MDTRSAVISFSQSEKIKAGLIVVEVAPPFDPSGNTALVGASLMFDILCLVADSLSARRN